MSTGYVAIRDGLIVLEDVTDGPIAFSKLTDRSPECVAVHPDRPDRVFCGTFDGGLHRSEDGGETFSRVGQTAIDPDEDAETAERRGAGDVSVMALAINQNDPNEIWAGTEPSALFHSQDGGDTWKRITGLMDQPSSEGWSFPPRPYTHHVRWIEVDPADPSRVYVGIEAGALLVTPDRGETWIDRPEGSRRDNHTLATHPEAPGRVYSAAGDGYAESTTKGTRWSHPQSGLDHRYVWGLAVDPGDPNRVFVSSATGAGNAHGHGGLDNAEAYVYRREDGTPWERLDDRGLPMGSGQPRAVLAPGSQAGECFAFTTDGLFRTEDGGETWFTCQVDWPISVAQSPGRDLVICE